MVIGFLVALVLFSPLAYFLTRGVIVHAHQSGRPFWGVLFLFLAMLGGLSLLSLAMLAVGSMLGFSGTLALAALTNMHPSGEPGIVTMIGGLLIAIWNVIGFLIGPVCAFVAAKFVTIVGLVAALVKTDEKTSVTYLPIVAAGIALFAMWPFTAFLTFGL